MQKWRPPLSGWPSSLLFCQATTSWHFGIEQHFGEQCSHPPAAWPRLQHYPWLKDRCTISSTCSSFSMFACFSGLISTRIELPLAQAVVWQAQSHLWAFSPGLQPWAACCLQLLGCWDKWPGSLNSQSDRWSICLTISIKYTVNDA